MNPMRFYSLRADYTGQHDVWDQYNNNMLKYEQACQTLFESMKLVWKWRVHNHNMHKKNNPLASSSQAI